MVDTFDDAQTREYLLRMLRESRSSSSYLSEIQYPGDPSIGLLDLFEVATKRPVDLADSRWGIDFTGLSDSSAAFQAVLTANPASVIEISRPGVIRCDTGLTLTEFQTIKGYDQYLGAGGTAPAEIKFPALVGSQAAFTGGGNNKFFDVLIRGPMTGANNTFGFKSTAGSPSFVRTGFYGFAIGTSLQNALYSYFQDCEWNKTG